MGGSFGEIYDRLDRIEAKLDALLAALADEEQEPAQTLEGDYAGSERDTNQPL